MQRDSLALLWGAHVLSEEGWSGRTLGAYLAPHSGRVTHVQAKRGLFGKPENYSLDKAQVREDGALVLARAAETAPARGSVHLTSRTPVSIAGSGGALLGLILDRKTKAPRYVLASYQGDVRAIRLDLVSNIASGSPAVRLPSEEASALPVYRSDDAALRNALQTLAKASPVDDTWATVDLEVVEGTAHLSGNVAFQVQKEDAERAVRAAKGVLEVQNDIVSDQDVRLQVGAALARETGCRRSQVTIRSFRGAVTLTGKAPSQEAADRAREIACAVPGVRSLTSQIQVEEAAPQPEPAPAETPSEPVAAG
ncbi:MAG: BON domain-containing protein [Chloroflexi bacterium]|nr:BON domain-containing protein [Chloroflexota bacterium]